MSRKGNCLDNAPMENFFGILKQEMFYGEKYSSYEKLIEDIKEYIKWYNTKRIKENLKGMSPIDYRYIPLNNLFICPCFWVQLKNQIVFFY